MEATGTHRTCGRGDAAAQGGWLRKHGVTILLVLVLLAGLGLLLYPTVSNWVNQLHQSRALMEYTQAVSRLDPADRKKMLAVARAYNRRLAASGPRWVMTDAEKAEYDRLLDVDGSGIMCSIQIPKVGVQLPVYHGTDDATLQTSIGHIAGSSLPVGGKSTHSVLSGHRGLPSARLFSDIDQLGEGDTFTLTVLDKTLTYEVDQIRVVEPDDLSDLQIEKGKDYCTLVTCTPYGINTHRLLVRGHRIPNADGAASVLADAALLRPALMAPFLAIPILAVLVICVFATTGRRETDPETAYLAARGLSLPLRRWHVGMRGSGGHEWANDGMCEARGPGQRRGRAKTVLMPACAARALPARRCLLAAVMMMACAVLLLAGALVGAVPLAASAEQTGSLELAMKTTDGKAVSGGEIDLYQVASYSDGSYAYLGAFSSCETAIGQDGLSDRSYIAELVSLAKKAEPVRSASVADDGSVGFSSLGRGLYLIVQSRPADGYETCNPFLVLIPTREGGVDVYHVRAEPKVGPASPRGPESSGGSNEPDEPIAPVSPDGPDNPDEPIAPVSPSGPDEPIAPVSPYNPDDPGGSVSPGASGEASATGASGAFLPQTGQLWWPVWALGAAGVLLVALGIARRRRVGR